jgi:type II secretory pathway pseudopilin PulG
MASPPRLPALFSRRTAFTLVEMLMVLAVIMILVLIAVPNFLNMLARAKNTQCRLTLTSIKSAVATYHTDTRQWPESGSEHLYYLLSGLSPFSAKNSKRYKPPYFEFDAGSAGKDKFTAEYSNNVDRKITLRKSNGSTRALEVKDLKDMPPNDPYPGLEWKPLLDPWQRPIVYISPNDLKLSLTGGGEDTAKWGQRPWKTLIARDSERLADGTPPPFTPFGLNSGQFWSAGRDGVTAEADPDPNSQGGFYEPGNLIGWDHRDNDNDGRVDETDFKSTNQNPLPEDDISSW